MFGMIITFAGLGWTGFGVDVQIVNAAIGGNFSTRKAGWVASVATASNLDITPHSARQHVLGWIEDGTHTSCRSSGVLQGAFNQSSACLPNADRGTPCMFMYIDTANRIEKMEDWGGGNPTYNDLDCIEGNIPGLIRWKGQSGSNAPATLARMHLQYKINNPALKQYFNDIVSDDNFLDSSPSDSQIPRIRDMQPLQTAVHYLAAMQAQGAKTGYADRGTDFSREFTYEGRKYCPLGNCVTGGGQPYPYEALTFTRDWLFKWMDLVIDYPNAETNSRSYQHQAITAMRLLYDFGEPDMKKRAKMFLDFLFLDSGLQFSLEVNHWGGLFGRTYRQGYAWGSDPMPWYIYWGANNLHLLSQEGFTSGYRLSPLVESFPDLNGGAWILKKDSYRNTVFSTSGFNIAVNPSGNEWRINMRDSNGQGFPFDFWVNDFAGDSDPNVCSDDGRITGQGRTVSTCGGGECYSCLGAGGSLYRNNVLLQNLSKPTFHFTGSATSFDEVQGKMQSTADTVSGKTIEKEYFLNNNQWNYFREGKVGVAVNPGPGTGGIEVAIVDGSCSEDFCYPSFQDFASKSRSVGSASFTNGKGLIIDSSKTYVRPAQRLLAETNDSSRYVSWANRVMTVGYNGTCTYDFNAWTTTPSGCEGQGGSLGTGNPVCPDGLCNGAETQNSCPADCTNTGGGSCGNPGSQCSVGSCAGTCDSTGNQCVKSDPNCGGTGAGSPPDKPKLCFCPNGSCPAQCTGSTGGSICGQNGCEPGETAQSCPADCGSGPTCNNNRTCDPGETTTNCPADCPPAQVCTPNQSCKYTSQNCAGTCNAQGTLCSDADASDGCPNYPPVTGLQPFPHVAAFTWGGAVPWYDAKFDLMMTSANSADWAAARKSLNPNMILLTTRDINGGADIWKTPGAFPEAAWVHTSKGQTAADRCKLYSDDTFLANYTNYAPTVFSGQRYNVYVGDWFAQIVPRPAFDGYASDGLWPGEQVCTDDVDLDANGINDYSPQQNPPIDVNAAFREGAEVVSANLRRTAGDAYILLNSGGWDDAAWQYKDGMVSEHASIGQENIDWWWWIKDQHDAFATAKSGRPIVLLMDGNATAAGYGGTPSPTKNDFQFMRFGLTLMSLNNGYFSMADAYGGESHNYVDYYDEFDVNLGLPTGSDQEILPHVYARFFQNGAVIHNSSASSVTVTNAQLSALSGYAGPYYRFQGGQDPTVNNGQLFDSVTLNMRQLKPYLGDGIILVKDGLVNGKSQRVVVSDIVIDNVESGTSPGSTKASLSGFNQLQSDCDRTVTDYYTVRCVVSTPVSPDDSQPVATSSNAGAVAQFTPTIGVAGKYNVYEWHGQINGDCMSVPISTQGMSCAGIPTSIDQSANWGQWNLLGQCILSTGNTSGITMTAPGNCIAQADAFRFEYVP